VSGTGLEKNYKYYTYENITKINQPIKAIKTIDI